jgi:two-component system NtrC family response regulator
LSCSLPHPWEVTEGLLAFEKLIGLNALITVIIVSGNSKRQNTLAAAEKIAHDIFPKPVDMDELKVVLKGVCQRIEFETESLEEHNMVRRMSFEKIIGTSYPMQKIFANMQKVVHVLIAGESRTGKELIVNSIHNLNKQKVYL